MTIVMDTVKLGADVVDTTLGADVAGRVRGLCVAADYCKGCSGWCWRSAVCAETRVLSECIAPTVISRVETGVAVLGLTVGRRAVRGPPRDSVIQLSRI